MLKPPKEALKPLIISELTDDYIERNYHAVTPEKSLLFLFMDGVGIGFSDDPSNPFLQNKQSFFYALQHKDCQLPMNGICVGTDPLLHIPGLPQSATGQTALFCGLDAARILGRHIPGIPTITLRRILAKESIFLRMMQNQQIPALANGYSDLFFSGERRLHSASTLAYHAANLPFRSFADVRAGKAVFMDITNRAARKFGFNLPKRSTRDAAQIISKLTQKYPFVMFEYFLTDKAGHTGKMGLARRAIDLWEDFLLQLLQVVDLEHVQIVVTSDHGNVESLAAKNHTRNLVPTMLWGRESSKMAKEIHNIVDVHNVMTDYLALPRPQKWEESHVG